MIQRIQTIYLFLVALLSILAIVVPLPFVLSGTTALEFNDFVALMVLLGLVALLSIGTIFLYKNRVLQMNLCRLGIVLLLGVVGTAIWFALKAEGQDMPQIGAGFPLLGIFNTWFAMRGIKADEKLVRSMYRLR